MCDPDRVDSLPKFVEVVNCHYIFTWHHAAACPVRTVAAETTKANCSVTSPESGFTFDLSSLYKEDGWLLEQASHHDISRIGR